MQKTHYARTDIFIVLLFFVALVLLGFLGSVFLVKDFAKARASTGWPVQEAILLTPKQVGDVRYVYSVRGRSYESERNSFFTAFWRRRESPGGPGEVVDAYVDPVNPEMAVLRPGGAAVFFGAMAMFFISLVFFGVAGIVRLVVAVAPVEFPEQSTTES